MTQSPHSNQNTYFLVGGDFNRRSFKEATKDHPDIKPAQIGPTRNLAELDVLGSNMNDTITDLGTVEPIKSLDGVPSNHRTAFVQYRMPGVPSYNIQSYSYYHLDAEGDGKFKD